MKTFKEFIAETKDIPPHEQLSYRANRLSNMIEEKDSEQVKPAEHAEAKQAHWLAHVVHKKLFNDAKHKRDSIGQELDFNLGSGGNLDRISDLENDRSIIERNMQDHGEAKTLHMKKYKEHEAAAQGL
jgi:hypothetical protein